MSDSDGMKLAFAVLQAQQEKEAREKREREASRQNRSQPNRGTSRDTKIAVEYFKFGPDGDPSKRRKRR